MISVVSTNSAVTFPVVFFAIKPNSSADGSVTVAVTVIGPVYLFTCLSIFTKSAESAERVVHAAVFCSVIVLSVFAIIANKLTEL